MKGETERGFWKHVFREGVYVRLSEGGGVKGQRGGPAFFFQGEGEEGLESSTGTGHRSDHDDAGYSLAEEKIKRGYGQIRAGRIMSGGL